MRLYISNHLQQQNISLSQVREIFRSSTRGKHYISGYSVCFPYQTRTVPFQLVLVVDESQRIESFSPNPRIFQIPISCSLSSTYVQIEIECPLH